MGQVLVRNLEEDVIETLKRRAAESGLSLEEQLRIILRETAGATKREDIEEVMARCRAMTPPGPRILAEDIIREIRDNE
jgi:plasmid stability protein